MLYYGPEILDGLLVLTIRHDRDSTLPHPTVELHDQIRQVVSMFSSAFDIPIFPNIGNWDTMSKNNADSNDFNSLFDLYSPLWSRIESDQIRNTFMAGGYFEYTFSNRLSVISLNTLSWFTDSTTSDCGQDILNQGDLQLKWLDLTLSILDANNRQALILGHVPPVKETKEPFYKPNCFSEYFQLINKYSNVIIASYYGHTNRDVTYLHSVKEITPITEFTINDKDLKTTEFTAISFVGPSIVPHYTSAFRVIELQSMENNVLYLQSHKQYALNITDLNLNRELGNQFQLEYQGGCNSSLDWKLANLKRNSWNSFFTRIQHNNDSELYNLYQECIMLQLLLGPVLSSFRA